MKKIHYCGRIEHKRGVRLAGWPVCSWGIKAKKIKEEGNQTYVIFDVNCAKCLEMYARRTNK
jgi:hypothetical protein